MAGADAEGGVGYVLGAHDEGPHVGRCRALVLDIGVEGDLFADTRIAGMGEELRDAQVGGRLKEARLEGRGEGQVGAGGAHADVHHAGRHLVGLMRYIPLVEVLGGEAEADAARLARRNHHALEAAQLAQRLPVGRAKRPHIELCHFLAVAVAGVGDIYAYGDGEVSMGFVFVGMALHGDERAVMECGVAEAVAEGELRREATALEPAVAAAPVVGEVGVVPFGQLLVVDGHGHGQAACGVDGAEEDIGDAVAGFLTAVEGIDEGGDVGDAVGQRHDATALQHHDEVGVGGMEAADELLLDGGQGGGGAVLHLHADDALALQRLVETSGEDDDIGSTRSSLGSGEARGVVAADGAALHIGGFGHYGADAGEEADGVGGLCLAAAEAVEVLGSGIGTDDGNLRG